MTLALWLCLALAADDPPATPNADALRFFETSVRPVLAEHCLKCHGPDKQWANLRLDHRDALLSGGDSGPAIVPGQPAESRLIRAVRQLDDDLKMPPEGPKLTDRQIADLVRWIEMGAPFPKTDAATDKRHRDPNHWSFQPPQRLPLPAVQRTDWVRSPVDAFILAKLEAAGLSPAPSADNRTLIRRLTFDLLGLPPTPGEVAEFVADDRPDAYERLVDRLLASPAYGERWARHWLDVARYADSNGLDENVAHGNAWRYRDFVVNAFNRDEPYDRFLTLQLTGDLLPAQTDDERHEQLIATGFLAIGPKVLAEVDEAKMQMDIVDEQIDTVGRAFLGLTLGCARCHDHKFDPISTVDYYGLAGIFKSTRTMEHYKKVARWYENVLESPQTAAVRAAHEAKVAAKKQEIAEFMAMADEEVRRAAAPETNLPANLEPRYSAETTAALKKLRDELVQLEKNPPELPSAMGAKEGRVADVPVHIRGNPLKLGNVVPRHVPAVLRGPDAPQFTLQESGRRELAAWLTDPRHPLTSRVLVNRIWRWHFGRGLVPSTDNFGLLGEPPSHPELLDWLTVELVEGSGLRATGQNGNDASSLSLSHSNSQPSRQWSLKALHRLIVTSSTYRQSSAAIRERERPESVSADADPENRLFGRAFVRRLEAEAVRDAMLAVSGQLDDTFGGSLLTVKNRAYFFDHTSKDLTDYSSPRRSLYLPVVRNNLYDVFQLLDAPDATIPTSDRPTTTVAPQALLMLNSDFVMQCAAKFAERLLNGPGDDVARMQQMYRLAYGRNAVPAEVTENARFLDVLRRSQSATEPLAWSILCQTVLAANEFVYVE